MLLSCSWVFRNTGARPPSSCIAVAMWHWRSGTNRRLGHRYVKRLDRRAPFLLSGGGALRFSARLSDFRGELRAEKKEVLLRSVAPAPTVDARGRHGTRGRPPRD